MFVTKRAVCLLVCDASKFKGSRDGSSEEEEEVDEDRARSQMLYGDVERLEELGVCQWLRCLSWRVPRCDVVLVATKCDLVSAEAVGDIADRMETACRHWMREWNSPDMMVNLETGVSRTSCAIPAGGRGCFPCIAKCLPVPRRVEGEAWTGGMHDNPKDCFLWRLTHKPGAVCRGLPMVIPRGWDVALKVIDALSTGRDPLYHIRGGSESKDETGANRGILMDELTEHWLHVVDVLRNGDDDSVNIRNPERALGGALNIREYEGHLLRHGPHIFLDVAWLTSVLKPLLNHNVMNGIGGSIDLGKIGERKIVLRDRKHKDSWRRLKEEGILEPSLAHVLWPGGLAEHVLPTLESIGLTIPLPDDDHGGLVALLRLPTDCPEPVRSELEAFRSKHSAALRVAWEMNLGVPPGIVEKMRARCSRLGEVRTFWRYGVLIQRYLRGEGVSGTFGLFVQYSVEAQELVMEAYGNMESVTPWAALSFAISAVQSMCLEFPGLPWEASLECPCHTGTTINVSEQALCPGDSLLDHGRRCQRCHLGSGDFGALALELVVMVDVTRPSDDVLREMKERFDRLQEQHSSLRPKDTRIAQSEELEIIKEAVREALRTELPATPGSTPEESEQILSLLKELLDNVKSDDGVKDGQGPLMRMLKAIRGGQFDTPRLACILPPWRFEQEEGLSDEEQGPLVWMDRLKQWQERDFREGKGWFMKEQRLFLICAHTYRLVPCGAKGQGYELRALRKWVERTLGGAAIVLEIVSTTLGAMTAVHLPGSLVGEVAGAGLDSAREQFTSQAKACLEGFMEVNRGSPVDRRREVSSAKKVTELRRKAYEALRDFVEVAENEAREEIVQARWRAKKNPLAASSIPSFVYFEDVMEQVHASDGDGTVQWVLQGQSEAWHAARARRSTP